MKEIFNMDIFKSQKLRVEGELHYKNHIDEQWRFEMKSPGCNSFSTVFMPKDVDEGKVAFYVDDLDDLANRVKFSEFTKITVFTSEVFDNIMERLPQSK